MSELDEMWIHTVAVQTRLGTGAFGEVFADPEPARCYVEDEVQLVRDDTGAEVVSRTSVFADLDLADLFTVGSKVTTSTGRESQVLAVGRAEGDPDGGLNHLEVHLS